jgi:hypothetical protein
MPFQCSCGRKRHIAAIGALFYVMPVKSAFFSRHYLLRNIQATETEQETVDVIATESDNMLGLIIVDNGQQTLIDSILVHLPGRQPGRMSFKREDFTGAPGLMLYQLTPK